MSIIAIAPSDNKRRLQLTSPPAGVIVVPAGDQLIRERLHDAKNTFETGCDAALRRTIHRQGPDGVRLQTASRLRPVPPDTFSQMERAHFGMTTFQVKLHQHGLSLLRDRLHTLQINVGRKCNQACRHCHVDAGPWRTEMMVEKVAHRIGDWITRHKPEVVDITGGAPELSEFFRYFVETGRRVGAAVMDRCNLTIIEEPGHEYLPEYFARHGVEVIASLPCYTAENVAKQRGNGVFEKSIAALKKLNAHGYGTALPLDLVYNPVGPKLPAPQAELEADYKEVLEREFGIVFNRLFTLTNQPIARFAEDLRRHGKLEEYMELLASSFNLATVDGLMCRTTLSVGWMGEIYDCDFNQMLGMQISNGKPLYLWDVTPDFLQGWTVRTGEHCLACTAGCGSSCTGALRLPSTTNGHE